MKQLRIHSHRGEDGQEVLIAAGRGDTVRRQGYRRHWFIERNEGQMVLIYPKHGDGELWAHADELTMITKAKK